MAYFSLPLTKILILLLGLITTGNCLLNIKCAEDNKQCTLVPKDESTTTIEVKALSLKCLNDDCKESLVLGENNQMYMCQNLNKRFGECQHLLSRSSLRTKNALSELLDESIESEEADSDEEVNKRQLPFETLNYGRKRQLPFETLNFGKRRYLPFETMLYGKRSLPFETLNYGKKRAYIPIDGYIMGRR